MEDRRDERGGGEEEERRERRRGSGGEGRWRRGNMREVEERRDGGVHDWVIACLCGDGFPASPHITSPTFFPSSSYLQI